MPHRAGLNFSSPVYVPPLKKRRLDVWVAKHVCDINFQLKSLQRFWWPEMPSDDYHWQAHMYGVQCPPKFNFWILLVLLAFDVVVLPFVLTSAIQHSSFQFLYSNWRFDIVSQFNIQVYAIQHSTLENACFRYPTAIQSMTFSVGSENYQNSPCVGASRGRSHYPRQQLLPRKTGAVVILFIPNTLVRE